MNLPVRLRSAAENDVAAQARYLQDHSAEVAIHFLDAFDAAISLLRRSPGIGGPCRFRNAHIEGIRVWPIAGFKNHLIFYRVLPDELEIVRVLHGARDLNSIFGESAL